MNKWVSEWVKGNTYIYVNVQKKKKAQTISERETSKWQKFRIKNKIGEKIDSKTSCLGKVFYVEFDIKSKEKKEEEEGEEKGEKRNHRNWRKLRIAKRKHQTTDKRTNFK